MAGSSNQWVYSIGATQVQVQNSVSCLPIIPPKGCNGMWLRWLSGGSLCIASSAGSTTGFNILAADIIKVEGPATFFLNAFGATAIAGIAFSYSSGGLSGIP